MQLEELVGGIEKEELLIIKDYMVKNKKKRTPEIVYDELSELSYEDLTKESNIAKLLGYDTFDNYDEVGVYTRGYRIMRILEEQNSLTKSLKSIILFFQ